MAGMSAPGIVVNKIQFCGEDAAYSCPAKRSAGPHRLAWSCWLSGWAGRRRRIGEPAARFQIGLEVTEYADDIYWRVMGQRVGREGDPGDARFCLLEVPAEPAVDVAGSRLVQTVDQPGWLVGDDDCPGGDVR
jgi:hypothetical protein